MRSLNIFSRKALVAAFALCVCASVQLSSCASTEAPVNANKTVKIGALLQLTAGFSDLSAIDKAALELALEDANAEAVAAGSDLKFALDIEDTRADSAGAVAAMNALLASGTKIALGIATSQEAAIVLPIAAANNMLLVSNSSTATSLTIANDNLLRLIPDDRGQAKAIASIMKNDGIEHVILFNRGDTYGDDLRTSLDSLLPALGITVERHGSWSANIFSPDRVADEINRYVDTVSTTYGSSTVGVCIIGFDPVGAIMSYLPQSGGWKQAVRWYGSDGTALSERLLQADVASVAEAAYFPNPLFGIDTTGTSSLAARIKEKSGAEPYSNSFLIYDGLRIAVKAYLSGVDKGNITALRDKYVQIANQYVGVSGRMNFNAAGDRQEGLYDFWAVRSGAWKKIGYYLPADGGFGSVVKY